MNPKDLRYSKEHEWLRLESDAIGVIGITEFAAESLGDVVFVELPELGTELTQFEKMGEIESVKAVSDLYVPIGGQVLELNEALVEAPELVNDAPYESGWMLRISVADSSQVDLLMTSDQYDSYLASQEE
jgi:glycine cleavage system H protein